MNLLLGLETERVTAVRAAGLRIAGSAALGVPHSDTTAVMGFTVDVPLKLQRCGHSEPSPGTQKTDQLLGMVRQLAQEYQRTGLVEAVSAPRVLPGADIDAVRQVCARVSDADSQ